MTNGKYRNALVHLRNVERNNNFIINAQSVPGLAEYLHRITVRLATLNQRRQLNTAKSTNFGLIGQAERLQNLISSIEQTNNGKAANAKLYNEAMERHRKEAAEAKRKAANAKMYNEAMERLRKEAAEAKAELAKAKAAKTHTAAANAAKRANAHANAAANAAKKAGSGNSGKKANLEAKKAATAAERAEAEAEQKRINSLIGEHVQRAEKIVRNTRAELNNINKNNEYTIKNESINRYAKLYEKYFKNMNSVYKNITSLIGKHPREQIPGLNARAMNLLQRIANGFNASKVAERRHTAAAAEAARAARAANSGLTGNTKVRQNIANARSKLANHIAKGTPENLREASELQRRIRILEKKLSK